MTISHLPRVSEWVHLFQNLRYDPNASRYVELLSGAFIWSDESPPRLNVENVQAFELLKVLAGYRASVIRGAPNAHLAPTWLAFMEACPTWPGFRPERADSSLKDALDAENDGLSPHLHHVEEVCDRAKRINELRQKHNRKWWRFWRRFT